MANVSIKFNNKEFLLSCEDGQEEHLEHLSLHLDEKFNKLKSSLGNIGENKLLLITSIKIMDEYFETNKKIKVIDNEKNFGQSKSIHNGVKNSLHDNIITIASETGVNPVMNGSIKSKGRVQPGGILAINTDTGEIIINKAAALKNKQVNVAAHEFLHGIMAQTFKGNPAAQKAFGKSVLSAVNLVNTKISKKLKDQKYFIKICFYLEAS